VVLGKPFPYEARATPKSRTYREQCLQENETKCVPSWKERNAEPRQAKPGEQQPGP